MKIPHDKFCVLPWVSLEASPIGTVRPCCLAKDEIQDEYGTKYQLKTSSFDQIRNSSHMRQLRNEFIEGKLPGAERHRGHHQIQMDFWGYQTIAEGYSLGRIGELYLQRYRQILPEDDWCGWWMCRYDQLRRGECKIAWHEPTGRESHGEPLPQPQRGGQ